MRYFMTFASSPFPLNSSHSVCGSRSSACLWGGERGVKGVKVELRLWNIKATTGCVNGRRYGPDVGQWSFA